MTAAAAGALLSRFTRLSLPAFVVGALIPGTALGIALGRREVRTSARRPGPVVLAAGLTLAVEGLLTARLGLPAFGLSAYILCVGRAARRVDPRLRALAPTLGLNPLGDVEFPLVAPGVFAGASLAFGMQVAARLSPLPALLVLLAFGFAAFVLDWLQGQALDEAGAARGSTGPALFPHLSVAEHLAAACPTDRVPGELESVLQRRPRHLSDAQRDVLAAALGRHTSPEPTG